MALLGEIDKYFFDFKNWLNLFENTIKTKNKNKNQSITNGDVADVLGRGLLSVQLEKLVWYNSSDFLTVLVALNSFQNISTGGNGISFE